MEVAFNEYIITRYTIETKYKSRTYVRTYRQIINKTFHSISHPSNSIPNLNSKPLTSHHLLNFLPFALNRGLLSICSRRRRSLSIRTRRRPGWRRTLSIPLLSKRRSLRIRCLRGRLCIPRRTQRRRLRLGDRSCLGNSSCLRGRTLIRILIKSLTIRTSGWCCSTEWCGRLSGIMSWDWG